MATPEPKYKLLQKQGNFELREYEPYIVAQVKVPGNFNNSVYAGFGILADYIFGNNISRSKIAMTAPVAQELKSEKIAMTAPVAQELAGDEFKITFALPADLTLENAPKPVNKDIKLIALPQRRVAVIRFSGYANEGNSKKRIAELQKILESKQLRPKGNFIVGQYNMPLTPGWFRRNEIMIEVEN